MSGPATRGKARRDRPAHDAHWAKILANEAVIARTIVGGDVVVGNIVSYVADGERHLAYWIGRTVRGHGRSTAAVAEYVAGVGLRPLHAHLREHNLGSIRVPAKCGFVIVGRGTSCLRPGQGDRSPISYPTRAAGG